MGFTALVARARRPRAAPQWLARAGECERSSHDPAALDQALAGCRCGVTRCGAPTRSKTLAAIGARTLGDFVALPRAGLARRFGPTLLDDLDRALGRRPIRARSSPRRPSSAPASSCRRRCTQAEALLFAARRLFVQLEGFLAARAGGVQRLALRLCHRGSPGSPKSPIGLVAPAATPRISRCSRASGSAGSRCPRPVRAIAPRRRRRRAARRRDLALFADDAVRRARARLAEARRAAARPARRNGGARPRGRRRASAGDASRPVRLDATGTHGAQHGASGTTLGRARPFWLLRRAAAARGGRRAPHRGGPLEAPRRPRAHRIGLVGRRRRRARLLRRADRRPRARLGLPRARAPPGGWFLHGLFA